MILAVKLEITPVGKARARVTKFGNYTPKKTRDFEKLVRDLVTLELRRVRPNVPLPTKDPVRVSIRFSFLTPKSWTKKKTKELLGRPHASKPDIDNLAKAVTDALLGIVFEDDSQIYELTLIKRWGAEDCVTVFVDEYQ